MRSPQVTADLQGPRLKLALELVSRGEFANFVLDAFSRPRHLRRIQVPRCGTILRPHQMDAQGDGSPEQIADLLRLRSITGQNTIESHDVGSGAHSLFILHVKRTLC